MCPQKAEHFQTIDVSPYPCPALQVSCYTINPADKGSLVRKHIEAACEHFVDINHLSDVEAAERILTEEVDILINLGGYTQYMRNGIFALMPAPIQVCLSALAWHMPRVSWPETSYLALLQICLPLKIQMTINKLTGSHQHAGIATETFAAGTSHFLQLEYIPHIW